MMTIIHSAVARFIHKMSPKFDKSISLPKKLLWEGEGVGKGLGVLGIWYSPIDTEISQHFI